MKTNLVETSAGLVEYKEGMKLGNETLPKQKGVTKRDLGNLRVLLNECWSELNENRIPEAKSDLIEAMEFLHRMMGSPVPKYPWQEKKNKSCRGAK